MEDKEPKAKPYRRRGRPPKPKEPKEVKEPKPIARLNSDNSSLLDVSLRVAYMAFELGEAAFRDKDLSNLKKASDIIRDQVQLSKDIMATKTETQLQGSLTEFLDKLIVEDKETK